MPFHLTSALARRLARPIALMLVSAVPIVGLMAAPAHADDATQKQVLGSTTCSRDLVRSGSGKAKLSASGYSYVDADAGHAKISTTRARVNATSCSGTGDNGVSVGSLKVTMQWTITSTGLGSCSFGLPSGFSCTINSTEVVIKRSYTCSNTSHCSKKFADEFNVYPREGYKIASVRYQEYYSGKQPRKDRVSGSTNQRRWGA